MENILSGLMKEFGPEVTKQVSSQFGLSQKSAEKVLPTVAPLVASGLKEKMSSPDAGGMLSNLLSSAGSGNLNVASLFSGGGGSQGSMVSQLFGSNLNSIVSGFASKLGTSNSKAQGILVAVVPLVVSYFSKKAGGGKNMGNLASMLGAFGGSGKMDDLIGTATKSGLMGKLSGLLGKKS